MKHLLLTTIAAVVLVGCGGSQQSTPAPESKPVEPVAEATQTKPPISKAQARKQEATCWQNTKIISLSLIMFAKDHDGKLPWQVSEKDGGSMEYIRPRSDKNALLAASGELVFDENAWRHFLALGPYLGNTLKKSFICPTSGIKVYRSTSGYDPKEIVSSSDDVSYWLLTDDELNLNNVKNPEDAVFSVCPHHPDKSYIVSTALGRAMNVHWPKMRQKIIRGEELKAEAK